MSYYVTNPSNASTHTFYSAESLDQAYDQARKLSDEYGREVKIYDIKDILVGVCYPYQDEHN